MNTGELLTEMRQLSDDIDGLNDQLKLKNQRWHEIETELMRHCDAAGLDKIATEAGTFAVADGMRAKYDPERWQEIVRWAVANGHDYIIQRRLTDAKVRDLVIDGVALPDGLTLESYRKASFRRNV